MDNLVYDNKDLTRIHMDTRFVICMNSGRVLLIYKKDCEKNVVLRMLRKGIINDISVLKYNKYGDLLITDR